MKLYNDNIVYNALTKINKIGKNITNDSKYILSNGFILGTSKQEMSDTEANPVSIGIINSKVLESLQGVGSRIGLLIDGNLLYRYSTDYEFDSITIGEKELDINFVYLSVDDNAYIENFIEILRNKKFSEQEIEAAKPSNFTSNIDMYDLFLDYKKNYEPVKRKTIISMSCKYVKTKNNMFKKVEKIVDMLNDSERVYEEDIKKEILDIIIGNKQPVNKKFNLLDGNMIKVRLMKSLFNPIASKSTASVYIDKYADRYLMSLRIDTAPITLFNIYEVLDY